MIKLNTQKDNPELLATQKSPSNTTLFLHQPPTLSTNTFKSSLPLPLDSQILNSFLFFNLDYLRISSDDLTRRQFEILEQTFFFGINNSTIDKPCHPCPKISKSKKYQKKIVSQPGIAFYFTKKAKNKGINTRYVYDVMIDLKGSYLANLSLIEQIELINYLNSNYKLKCHRIDIAIDDYSKELFPVLQMREAYLKGNCFGFQVIDDDYLKVIDRQFKGTLGLGSRRSGFYVRIYTKDDILVRWETELKQRKAQKLFDELARLAKDKSDDNLLVKSIHRALLDAAIGQIDFRDKNTFESPKNASRTRTKRLSFWSNFIDLLYSSIENKTDSKSLDIS